MPWNLDYHKPEPRKDPDWISAIIFLGACFLFVAFIFGLALAIRWAIQLAQ